jgi:oligopeptidase B
MDDPQGSPLLKRRPARYGCPVEVDGLNYAPSPGIPAAARRPGDIDQGKPHRVDDLAWLIHPDDPRTAEHLRGEHARYERTLAPLSPLRAAIEAEMAGRFPAADASVAWRRSGVIYFTRSSRGHEHDRLYSLDPGGGERLLLDPNTLREGEPLPLVMVEPSPSGTVTAYAVTGPDGEAELRFRDAATGRDLPDRIHGVGGCGAWRADSRAFVYTRHDGRRADEILHHVIGTPPGADESLLAEDDPRFSLRVHRSRDGRWIVLTSAASDSSEVSLVAADDPLEAQRLVAGRRPGISYGVEPLPGGWTGDGVPALLVVTDDGAPEFQLVTSPLPGSGQVGDPAAWTPVNGLPVVSGERLDGAVVMARHIILLIRRDAEPFLRILDRPVSGLGAGGRLSTREVHPGVPYGQLRLWHPDDPNAASVVIVEENLVTAPAWVEIDLATGARTVVKRTPLLGVDPTLYVTDRLYAPAPDGVTVPVTIARRKDARRGRTAGLVLSVSGGFEQCHWPRFDPATLSLLDRDLVVAIAHVRGGGELGRSWWKAARGPDRQRSFVDLFAARDALVAAGWAGEVRGGARVVVRGTSVGGQLAAAVYSRGPRMWRAVVAETPLVDPVTTLCDETQAPPPGFLEEWGDPLLSAEDLATMLRWSPYDNPPPPGRPPLLVTASTTDPRHPLHEATRWVARLRASDTSRSPSTVLLRVDSGPGTHLLPAEAASRMRYEAEILAWVLDQLGLA